ncbi:MAG: zinc-dependent metalloprotease [Rubrivivax sp.]
MSARAPMSLQRLLVVPLALLGAAGCASAPGAAPGAPQVAAVRPTPPAGSARAAAPAGAAGTGSGASAATPAPGSPPPFATVIKDARRIDGALTAWQREDRLWLEIGPEQLGRPFLFTPKLRQGIGEGLLTGGLLTYPVAGAGGAQVVEFTRVHNTIRFQARNNDVAWREGAPEARTVQAHYSHSLLGVAPVASQPHPDRKSVLIDATSLVLNDVAGVGMLLQRQFRQGYSLDTRNSVVTAVRARDGALVVETQQHWYTSSVATGQTLAPSALPGGSAPTVPRYLPDTRSLLLGLHLSFVPLPAQPMRPRRADARVGLFSTRVLDFGDELARTPVQRHVLRWRLERKDPDAPLSEPVRPITFWMDRNVPVAYRDTVRRAILEWNKAFERIGFANAIVVQQQPDDAAFDTLDPGHAAVRWLLSADPGFSAIGQTEVDPRSGEILGANVAFEGLFTRAQRYLRSQLLAAPQPAAGDDARASPMPFAKAPWLAALVPGAGGPTHADCRHGDALAEQAAYALDLMDSFDDAPPEGGRAQQFVLDYITDTVLHEVGHALGLRHNFRGSRAYTEAELSDPEFTRTHGTSGSVMDYSAVNLAPPGRSGGLPFQLTLGPYDYWAIEYAYRPAPAAGGPAAEEAMLQAVAARSADPQLAYGTDEDASFGLDAEALQFDLGADPLAFAAKRLEIARELFRRQSARVLPPERDYSVLQRSLAYALNDATRAVAVLVRQLGGLRTLRDHPGSGRDPIQPVDADLQRKAFELMLRTVFDRQAFAVPASLQRRLAPDYLDRADAPGLPTDFNLPQRVLDLQRAVLSYLMSDQLSQRLIDAQAKDEPGRAALEPAEVYRRVGEELWAELKAGRAVPAPRRELQRDHVNRLAFAVLRPSPSARADARGALRREARQLLAALDQRLAPPRRGARAMPEADDATRLHWQDCAESLRQALAAQIPRAAV